MTLKWLAACFATSLTLSVAHAQPYPSKPIRILVPSIARSAPDVRVRLHSSEKQTRPHFPFHELTIGPHDKNWRRLTILCVRYLFQRGNKNVKHLPEP